MTVEYTLSRDDYVAFNLFYARHDPAFMRKVRIIQGLGAAFLLGLGLAVGVPRGGMQNMMIFVLLAILFVLFVSNQARSVLEKQVRLATTRADNIPQGARALSCDAHGLRLRDDSGEQDIPFDEIRETVRTKTHLFMMTHLHEVIVVPLSAFESLDAAQLFYSALPSRHTLEK